MSPEKYPVIHEKAALILQQREFSFSSKIGNLENYFKTYAMFNIYFITGVSIFEECGTILASERLQSDKLYKK